MSYKILQSDKYLKRAAKFFKKHPNLLDKYAKTIKQLEIDPFYPSLRLHKLKGDLSEYYSRLKRYRKVITIDNPLWDKRTRINEAKKRLQEYKEQVVQGKRPNEKITIERLFDLYIKNQPDTDCTRIFKDL